ncbi:hypothetical protein [Hymenobacter convexus]|uniref:hypothetical protein n=1 Tax=Hymenobacter sp. CA1UV-4 TaxID=3063782 RepID=UPI002712FF1E|nr:hypothetical protein [Hymenobacter sp. CA1UV-4]MDO7851385.1 hypothetical protein [Hymenobacter sp. CA1UV-4]
MALPNRLASAPSLSSPSLQQPAPRDLPVYNPDHHIPPPPPMPTLSIKPKGMLHLHASLRQAISLRHGQPIDLIPPVWNSLFWHLDLRKCATRRVVWYDNTRVRAEGIKLPPGLVTEPLTLYLLPGEPAHPDYYPLLPANALAAPFYAHLAQ